MAPRYWKGFLTFQLALARTALAVLIAISCPALGQQDELASLNARFNELASQGKAVEALPVAQNIAELTAARFGAEGDQHAGALLRVAQVSRALGRYREAVAALEQAHRIIERLGGADELPGSMIQNELGLNLRALDRFDEAEQYYKRSLATREKKLGADHVGVAQVLNNLGSVYWTDGRYSEAEHNFKRALEIRERLAPDSPDHAESLNNLAILHWALGRYGEAEPLYRRALALTQSKSGESLAMAVSLNNLAALYVDQGRYPEAEPLFKRTLDIRLRLLPPDHIDIGQANNNLAWLNHQQRNFAEAEKFYNSALAIYEKLGADTALAGAATNNKALMFHDQGRHAEAVPLFEKAIAIRAAALGEAHAEVGQSHNKMALALQALGRFEEAETHYEKALLIREQALGVDHPDVVRNLDDIASLHEARGHWSDAIDFVRHAREIILRRARRGSLANDAMTQGSGRDEVRQTRQVFARLTRAAWELAGQQPKLRTTLQEEAFGASQWAGQSAAELALAQMAARQMQGAGALPGLARERQDLAVEWQAIDKRLHQSAASRTEQRDLAADAKLRDRLAAIDARRLAIDDRLKAEFPDYFAMANPEPLVLSRVQATLKSDEVMLLYTLTGEDAFAFAVTRSTVRWRKLAISVSTLTRSVRELRCGLDAFEWRKSRRCQDLLGERPIGDEPPFSLRVAYQLGEALLGPFRDMIAAKHILIVPSGSLTSLPFQVLLTEPARSDDYRRAAWLGTRQALTILPSVNALQSLRKLTRPSSGDRPYLGIGNPLLVGKPGNESDRQLAEVALDNQSCRQPGLPQRLARSRGLTGEADTLFRGALADVERLRQEAPLPETADELCAVGRSLKARDSDILLGKGATERQLKQMNETSQLQRYRVLHFATHGLTAGAPSGLAEPALLLTPPETASEADDGLLTSSEVARLKLDADWIILSACNTAAGDTLGAEALSGLARAFFYAGARAILVSHWYVDSSAAVALTTRALAEISRRPRIGRAEALRLSIKEFIAKGDRSSAHPARWAPFSVVGEGGSS